MSCLEATGAMHTFRVAYREHPARLDVDTRIPEGQDALPFSLPSSAGGPMNYVLDQLEQLMVSVQHHDITFIVFTVVALLFLGAILWLICCLLETRHDLRMLDKRLTEGHNKLAARLLEEEQNLNRVHRTGVNNFRLICKVGVEAGVLPESAVKEALEGVEE